MFDVMITGPILYVTWVTIFEVMIIVPIVYITLVKLFMNQFT